MTRNLLRHLLHLLAVLALAHHHHAPPPVVAPEQCYVVFVPEMPAPPASCWQALGWPGSYERLFPGLPVPR